MIKIIKLSIVGAITAFLFSLHIHASRTESVRAFSGYFWNQTKDAIFEIRLTQLDDKPSVEGITRWSKEPAIDSKNPDPALQGRALKDVVFLWGFTYDQRKNRWKDGKVYDPNNGKTYDAKMELDDDGRILKMRGYIGISLLGRTARFERVSEKDLPDEVRMGM